MITNRHIAKNWKEWIERPGQRQRTVCGTQSVHHGIPGITEQLIRPSTSRGVKNGWCTKCCYTVYKEILKLDLTKTNSAVRTLYRRCFGIVIWEARKVCDSLGEIVVESLNKNQRHPGPNKVLYDNKDECYLCREPGGGVWDHIIPISRGGSDNPYNLADVHPLCNMTKGNRLPWELNNDFPNMKLPHYFVF